MNLYSIIATLLATSVSADYFYDGNPGYLQPAASYYSPAYAPSYLGSDDPQPGARCYHGNQRNVAPATQAPYPPCWYKQGDGEWACFNQVNGKCPWDGAKSPPGSGGNNNVCYHGNQRNVPPATRAPYPPCWYKQSDGAWACFNQVNGQCPWPGAVGPQASAYLNAPSSYTRRPLYYNRRPFCYNGAQRNSINYGPNWPECWYRPNGQDWDCYSKVNGQCPFAGAVGPQVSAYLNTPSFLGSDDPQPGDKCYHGNQRNVAPATQAPYPPCWYKQGDGAWACFNQVNGKCPWDGAKNPPSSGGNSKTCYAGNMRDKPITSNYPPCWYKQNDGAWACFDKVNGQCPWGGAVGPQAFAYLNAPSFLGSDNPQSGDKCFAGNMRDKPVTSNYPPCWYKQGDGAWACFDKVNNKCPWDGAKNPPGSGGSPNTCYAGNMRDKPITSNYPPCWYKQNDGAWACFDKVNNKCPWDGAVGPQTSAFLNTPSFLGSDNPQSGDKCFAGNMRDKPVTSNYPPCWYKQGDGAWACFDKVNNKCPWDGAKNPPGSGGSPNTCYAGNMRDKPITSNYPPCWYKQNDGAWACFDKVNDKCPWDGAVGPQTSAFLSVTPQYTESPTLLSAVREFLLSFQ